MSETGQAGDSEMENASPGPLATIELTFEDLFLIRGSMREVLFGISPRVGERALPVRIQFGERNLEQAYGRLKAAIGEMRWMEVVAQPNLTASLSLSPNELQMFIGAIDTAMERVPRSEFETRAIGSFESASILSARLARIFSDVF